MSVDAATVRAARLRATRLREPDLPDVPRAVEHLLAVQGQELRPTLWGLACRIDPAARPGAAAALAALDDGSILRTHVLRPTWHLVRPADARWLIRLTGPRVARQMASTEKQWGLGDPGPGIAAVAAEVADGPRTRPRLAAALVARGVLDADAPGIALTHVLMHAELQQVVVSGPTADGAHAYAAFDDRVPAGYGPLGETFDREPAVRELWRRWLPGRAYATVKDLAQWSGLTLTELRAGLAPLLDAGEATEVPGSGALDGLTLVTTPAVHDDVASAPPSAPPPRGQRAADLLCAYDELVCSFGESRHAIADPRAPEPDRRQAFVHRVLVDGMLTARWRWPGAPPDDDALEVQWQRDPDAADRTAVARATAALGAHLRTSGPVVAP
ncbi:DNA glycosylase AlkZ-like family protein [Isoptericola aurantiacus]|uniref:DNA glycosylase AlkZ-like family protein n=1 Tax=Isoptericola aurantiacus TaxID=3377839 RepID=UPI00383AA915